MNSNFFAIVILSLVSFQALSKEYRYIDYSVSDSFENGRVKLVLDVSSGYVKSSDWVERLDVCDQASGYYCFSYKAVSFYVPRSAISVDEKWNGGGISFNVLRAETLHIFDVNKEVFVIKATRGDRNDLFYYSEDDGLIAIKHDRGNSRRVGFFMIVGIKGFPY
jgi:hypothetical protein